MREGGEAPGTLGESETDAGYDRLDGHVFTLLAAGVATSMDQPACAYPAGSSQWEIDEMYASARARSWFERVFPVPGVPGVDVVISWQGVSCAAVGGERVCIENARARVAGAGTSSGAHLTVSATFGTPDFVPAGGADVAVAVLPLRLQLIPEADTGHGSAEEIYLLDGAGGCRRARDEAEESSAEPR